VPLVYQRSEREGHVEIRVKPAWYVARYATLPFALPLLVAGPRMGMVGVFVCAAGLSVALGVRLFGFRAARSELRGAMRRGLLKVSGSAWDYRHPLRYEFTPGLPSATVVRDGR